MIGKSPHKHPATSSSTSRDSWAKVRLGDICGIVRGVSYKKDQASQNPEEGRVPVLRATNIQGSTLVLDSDLVYVPSTVVSDEQMLQVGDIVVATSSGSKHLVGKTAQVKQAWEGSFGAFCATLRPKVDIDHRYLGYFFSTQEYKDYISKKALGVNINNLRRGDLEEISVPVPPPEQQKLIVAEIEKQFSRLDEAVANLKRVKANLKRYKAAVLKAAVEGKLTEEWRKAHPDVEPATKLLERILTERRAKWKGKGKYKEPSLPPGDNLPEKPTVLETWSFVGMDQLLPPIKEAMKTGPFGSLLKKHEHKTEGIPVLGIENIETMRFVRGCKIYITKTKAEDLVGYRVMPHDVLISRSGTVGEVCAVPADIGEARMSTNLMKLSLLPGGMLPEFFILLFNGSPFVLNQVSNLCKGSTRNFLNQEILKQLWFVLPPMVEQTQIVAEVERRRSVIDKLEATVEANLTRANRLQQAILSQSFNTKHLWVQNNGF